MNPNSFVKTSQERSQALQTRPLCHGRGLATGRSESRDNSSQRAFRPEAVTIKAVKSILGLAMEGHPGMLQGQFHKSSKLGPLNIHIMFPLHLDSLKERSYRLSPSSQSDTFRSNKLARRAEDEVAHLLKGKGASQPQALVVAEARLKEAGCKDGTRIIGAGPIDGPRSPPSRRNQLALISRCKEAAA